MIYSKSNHLFKSRGGAGETFVSASVSVRSPQESESAKPSFGARGRPANPLSFDQISSI